MGKINHCYDRFDDMFIDYANGTHKILSEYKDDIEQTKEQFIKKYYNFINTGQFDLP